MINIFTLQAEMDLQNDTSEMANSTRYLDKISTDELAAVVSLYALLLLAIVTGNGLVLAAFSINERLRTATNKMIMGLAVSDILVGFVSIPFWLNIIISLQSRFPVSFVTYQVYITFDIFIGSASILQLTALSIERCHAIVRPLLHRTLSKKVYYVMVTIPWLSAAIVASLQPVQFGRWKTIYTLLMTTTCFFIPFVTIFIAYLLIYRYARCQPIAKHRSERKAYKKDLRLSVTLAVITCIFVVAWLPLFVMTLIATYNPKYIPATEWTARGLQFAKFCHYSNSAVNPFVYAFRNNEIIRTFRYIAHRLMCKEVQPELPLNRSSSYRKSSFSKSSERKLTNSSMGRGSSKSSSVKTISIKTFSGSRRSTGSLFEALDANSNQRNTSIPLICIYSTV